jgi:hypothetical protein
MTIAMAVLVPVDAASGSGWWSRYAPGGVRWWLVRGEGDAAGANGVAATVEQLITASAVAGTVWVARVEGRADHIRYVTEVVGGALHEAADSGRRAVRAVGGALGATQAVALLDATASAPLDATLVLVDEQHAADALLALADPAYRDVPGVRLIVLWRTADWAVIGELAEPLPNLRARVLDTPERIPSVGAIDKRGTPRPVSVGALIVALAIVVAAVATARWQSGRDSVPSALTQLVKPSTSPRPATLPGVVLGLSPQVASPFARLGPSAAYDPDHHQVVLYDGGQGNTWVWTPTGGWNRVVARSTPTSRLNAALAWDPTSHRVLLFGGSETTSGAVPVDTWAWDGSTWTVVGGSSIAPPGSQRPAMAYDEARGEMVLVTDASSGRSQLSTWTWRNGRWSLRHDPDVISAPSLGPNPMIAYDAATKTVLLVTPGDTLGNLAKTWSWDGTGEWHELHPVHQPAMTPGDMLVADPTSGRLMMLAAAFSPSPATRQTWGWDGNNWSPLHPSSEPSFGVVAASDPGDGVALVFGITGAALTLSDVWAWNGTTWVHVQDGAGSAGSDSAALLAAKPAGVDGTAAYDREHRNVVLLSRTSPTTTTANATWTWDGVRWTLRGTTRSPQSSGQLVADPATGTVMVLANGSGTASLARSDVWGWDGVDWSRLGLLPSGMSAPNFVVLLREDPATHSVLALTRCCIAPDGTTPASPGVVTWTWDGTAWTARHPAHQPGGDAFTGFSSVYDSTHSSVLVVSSDGSGGAGQTWLWDGADWTRLATTTTPPVDPAVTITLGDDPATHSVVLLERHYTEPITGDDAGGTYTWDGTSWTRWPEANDAPPAAMTPAVMFDPGIGRPVLLGADSRGAFEQWMWSGRTWLRLGAATR